MSRLARSVGHIVGRSYVSPLEAALALQIRIHKLPDPVREFQFDPARKWRSDFAWPTQKLLVECEGGEYTRGRHTRGGGFTKDCEKYNAAALAGWRCLRFTGPMIRSGQAIALIKEAIV